jgi:hypothetical protein
LSSRKDDRVVAANPYHRKRESIPRLRRVVNDLGEDTWRLVRKIRDGSPRATPGEVVGQLATRGVPVDWGLVTALAAKLDWREFVPEAELVDFIAEIASAGDCTSLLDPWAGAGVLLAGVQERAGAREAIGIERHDEYVEVAKQLDSGIEWILEEPLAALDQMARAGRSVTTIVSTPPWGLARGTAFGHEDRRISALPMDDQVVLLASRLLMPEGRAFVFRSDAFLTDTRSASLRRLLAEHDIHPWSVVSTPPEWKPLAAAAGNVIELRRGAPESLFVAKAQATDNAALNRNLQSRKPAKVPELGALVEPGEFHTWHRFEALNAFTRVSKGFGYPVVRLGDLAADTKAGSRDDDGGFDDLDNAIFLPAIGMSPALTSRSDLSLKAHNYFQVGIDPTMGRAEYLARFLNTPTGLLSRKSVETGAHIRKITLTSLVNAPVVLPPLDVQALMVTAQRKIEEERATLSSLQHDLWRSRDGVQAAHRSLRRYPEAEGLDSWLPRFPFPLASILWAYQATLDERRQVEVLLAFFEATAEFLVTILLSALRSSPEVFEDIQSRRMEVTEDRWTRASMGFWTNLGSDLAKDVRRMQAEGAPGPQALFKSSASTVEAITNKELFKTLDTVRELRNAWKGHGGLISDAENSEHLARLQAELVALTLPLSRAFEDVKLVRPLRLQFDGTGYEVALENLIGPSVPFREESRQTVQPLKTGALYLLHNDAVDALELLPLVRMKAGPASANACYFYSRLDGNEARFVSYHHTVASELTEADPPLVALIRELSGASGGDNVSQ